MREIPKWLKDSNIAHRGLHNEEIPENSLKSFENAIKNNNPIELDIREIKDGTIVVFHDDNIQRMTGENKLAKDLTQEDLKKICLKNSTEHIPTFKETLKLVNGQTPLLIEFKNTGKVGSLEKKALDQLRTYKGDFAVQSFNPFVLKFFKKNAPEFIRGQLSSFFENEKMSKPKKHILKSMLLNKITKPDFISYDISNLPNKYVEKYSKLQLLAWTVNSQEKLDLARKLNATLIFENINIKGE